MSEVPPTPPSLPTGPEGPTAYPPSPTVAPYPPPPPYLPYPPYPWQPGSPSYPQPVWYAPPYPLQRQPPRKDNTRTIYAIVAVVVLVLFLVCGGGTLLINNLSLSATNRLSTSVIVDEFCAGVEGQDYSTAYQQFSANLQQQYSLSQFTQDAEQYNSELGQISTCIPQGLATISGQSATISVLVTRALTPTPDASGNSPGSQSVDYTGSIGLVYEGRIWKIDSVDASLNLL
jgi:hypothetical protein